MPILKTKVPKFKSLNNLDLCEAEYILIKKKFKFF
jgi:hypothetical protein